MYRHRRACMTKLGCFCFAKTRKLQGFCLNFFNIFLTCVQPVSPVICSTVTPLAISHLDIWWFGISFFVFPKCSCWHLPLLSIVIWTSYCFSNLSRSFCIVNLFSRKLYLECLFLSGVCPRYNNRSTLFFMKMCEKVNSPSLLKNIISSFILHPLSQCPCYSFWCCLMRSESADFSFEKHQLSAGF